MDDAHDNVLKESEIGDHGDEQADAMHLDKDTCDFDAETFFMSDDDEFLGYDNQD